MFPLHILYDSTQTLRTWGESNHSLIKVQFQNFWVKCS